MPNKDIFTSIVPILL